jgi:hypothetical protein
MDELLLDDLLHFRHDHLTQLFLGNPLEIFEVIIREKVVVGLIEPFIFLHLLEEVH